MRTSAAVLLVSMFAMPGCTRGDFQLQSPSAPVPVLRGGPTVLTVDIARTGGFDQGVGVLVTGLPNGVTSSADFSPSQISRTGTSTSIVLTAGAQAIPGPATVQLTATADGGLARTLNLPISIQDPGGALDTSFAQSGRLEQTTVPLNTGVCSVAVTSSAVAYMVRIEDQYTLEQFDSSGLPVPDFGEGGVIQVTPTASGATGCGLAIDSDATVLVAATSNGSGGAPTPLVARYTSTGLIQTTFGNAGRAPLPVANELVTDLALLHDRRIAVATETGAGVALTVLTSAGQVDSSFGSGGRVSLNGQPYGRARAIGLPDGRVLLAATLTPSGGASSAQVTLLLLSATGSPDPGFGTQGVVSLSFSDIPQGLLPAVGALAVAANGSLLVSVEVPPNGSQDGDVGRLLQVLPSGAFDASFGGGTGAMKIAATDNAPGSTYGLHAMAVLSGGRVVGVGTAKTAIGHQLGLYRFLPSGAVDSAFGQGAPLLLAEHSHRDTTGYDETEGRALALYPDGRMLVAGDIGLAGTSDIGTLLARFWP